MTHEYSGKETVPNRVVSPAEIRANDRSQSFRIYRKVSNKQTNSDFKEVVGRANWYKRMVKNMPMTALRENILGMTAQLQPDYKWPGMNRELTQAERLDTTEALRIAKEALVNRKNAKSVQMQKPHNLPEFKPSWPVNAPEFSLAMHSHFVDLHNAWRYNDCPHHIRIGSAGSRIDQRAESEGKTAFYFDSPEVCIGFVNFYELGDFILTSGSSSGHSYIQLENTFPPYLARNFLDELAYRMANIASLNVARQEADDTSGNHPTFVSMNNFNYHERMELDAIHNARRDLGSTFKGLKVNGN